MENQSVTLYIDLMLYGLESKQILFAYKIDQLNEIDKLTYNYTDEKAFFEYKRAEVMKKIKLQATYYNINILPLDIELGTNKIYIQKGKKKIRPLFQNIQFKNQSVSLDDLLKKKLMQGKIVDLYHCDKKRQSYSEYQSIFEECPFITLEKLEWNIYDNKDIEYILEFLKTKDRVYSIFRWILSNSSGIELEESFMNDIPLTENKRNVKTEERKREKYRYPYNDN